MDEPCVGLDPGAAHLLKERRRELCGRGGAIFFSTHVLEVAEKLCDRVAIIRQGRLVRAGTMAQVRGDDDNYFTLKVRLASDLGNLRSVSIIRDIYAAELDTLANYDLK